MRNGQASIEINASSGEVFDLVHDYTRRLEWDPFLREAVLLGDAKQADTSVSTRCAARYAAGGGVMVTDYISFHRPRVAAVKMISGPFFLASFAASIRHLPTGEHSSRTTYRYQFSTRPRWLSFLIDPVVSWVFSRETRRRLRALKAFLEDSNR